MGEHQPDLQWAPLPPRPKTSGRAWIIVAVIVAIAIVGALIFLLIPRSGDPSPALSPSPSPSATASTPSEIPAPEESPMATPPRATDPSIEVFRERVGGWLNDGPRGLDIIAGASGQDALAVVDTLQQDTQRLSDAQPPSSLDQKWREGVSVYAERLSTLRRSIIDESGVSEAIDAARASVEALRSMVGL